MQAYISRTIALINQPWHGTGSSMVSVFNNALPPICAYCGDEVYNEREPANDTHMEWMVWADSNYFHINDNTPICDARI